MYGFNMGSSPRSRATNEGWEFAKAWLGTALAFAVLQAGIRFNSNFASPQVQSTLIQALIVATLTAGIGIVLHELGHRVVARHYGAQAHFQANDQMLVISILMALAAGFLFAAPGAVYHSGYLTKRQNGLVAAAGPIVNMVLAILFLLAFILLRGSDLPEIVIQIMLAGYTINAWLGLFNMLPIGPIDGAKVLEWNTVAFGVLFVAGIALTFGLPRLLPYIF